jgi:hypothetical protein
MDPSTTMMYVPKGTVDEAATLIAVELAGLPKHEEGSQ